MARTIRSDAELRGILEAAITEALEDITDEVLELFKEQYIKKYVYESHGGNANYHDETGEPTEQFMNAWEWGELKKRGVRISREMFYDPSDMEFDKTTYLHGSKYSRPNDVRKTLMDILNKMGRSSSLWLSVSRPVAYWDRFIEDMEKGELQSIVDKHMSSAGFSKL